MFLIILQLRSSGYAINTQYFASFKESTSVTFSHLYIKAILQKQAEKRTCHRRLNRSFYLSYRYKSRSLLPSWWFLLAIKIRNAVQSIHKFTGAFVPLFIVFPLPLGTAAFYRVSIKTVMYLRTMYILR